MVENDQGERVPLHITSRVIADALHISQEGKYLTKWIDKHDKEFVFHMTAGREMTYADMRDPNMEPTLRLINQYIIFGKPLRFTHPNRAIAVGLQLALYHQRPTPIGTLPSKTDSAKLCGMDTSRIDDLWFQSKVGKAN